MRKPRNRTHHLFLLVVIVLLLLSLMTMVSALDVKSAILNRLQAAPESPSSYIAQRTKGTTALAPLVTCRFTADGGVAALYLNGRNMSSTVNENADKLFDWNFVKSMQFPEPRALENVFSFRVLCGSSLASTATSGFIIKCTSEDPKSNWNFVSAVGDPSWMGMGDQTNNAWTSSFAKLDGEYPVIQSTSEVYMPANPPLADNSKIWAARLTSYVVLRKRIVSVPLVRPVVTCQFTVDNMVRQVYAADLDLTLDVVGDLNRWDSLKTIKFQEPLANQSVFGVKGVEAGVVGSTSASGFACRCTSTDPSSSWNFESSLAAGWQVVPSPTVNDDSIPWDWYTTTKAVGEVNATQSTSAFYLVISPLLTATSKLWAPATDTRFVAFKKYVTRKPLAAVSTLTPGAVMSMNFAIFSPSLEYRAMFQTDGNFCVYGGYGGKYYTFKWCNNVKGVRLELSLQARLCMKDATFITDVWCSSNAPVAIGAPDARLSLLDDGRLVIMQGSTQLWSST